MFFTILYRSRVQSGTWRGASAQPRGQVACTGQLTCPLRHVRQLAQRLCPQAKILEDSYLEHTLESVA